MAAKHDLEHLLNGELAKLLTDTGVPAKAEVKQGNHRLDILADEPMASQPESTA